MFKASDFIEKFREEALERLQRLNEGYIQLESGIADREILTDLLREAHTLKGSAKMVGLSSISELAHKLEDVLIGIRDGRLAPREEVSETVFAILDSMLELTERGENDEKIVQSLCRKADIVTGKIDLNEDEASCDAGSNGETDLKKTLEESSKSQACEESIKTHEMNTVRIKSSQIDEQLNLVGEAVIITNQLLNAVPGLKGIVRNFRMLAVLWENVRNLINRESAEGDSSEHLKLFEETLESVYSNSSIIVDVIETSSKLNLVLSELHQKSMEMRMLPASYIFNLFPRAVRDMAKEFGKKIEISIRGEDTLIDKRVLEEIYDPLIHILRNSVDHGIEIPEERLAYGKPETGHIEISARQEGDRIIIKVKDDGRGIDPELIKKVALKKGLITEAEANSLSEKEAIYLIFKPGFSSKVETTETSGRGIGMDVVKLHVEERLKGHIEIETEKGRGTTFILTLPLTLAVVRCLLVRTGGVLFAVPTNNVQETLLFKDSDIVVVSGERQIKLRDQYIPFVKLSSIFGFPGIYEGRLALVISMLGKTIAYEVEEIVDEIPVVIKPIDEIINTNKLFAGATILGSGEVVLILNVGELVRSTRTSSLSNETEVRKKHKTVKKKPRILVVEDSLTTRELEISLLRAAGYEVEGAKDGLEALNALKKKRFDLVLTDIQMPRMDGYELIKTIKNDRNLKDIPMVVVSSKASERDIELGLKAGADAYITKNEFEKESLLSVIERLININ